MCFLKSLVKLNHFHLLLVLCVTVAVLLPGSVSSREGASGKTAGSEAAPGHASFALPDREDEGKASIETSNLFGVAGESDMNQAGDYAFVGNGSSALFLRPANTGITRRVFQMGDAVPGVSGSRADLISSPRLNSSGTLAFVVQFNTTDGFAQSAILTYDGVNLQKIVSSKDTAPGTGGAVYGQSIVFGGLNDSGAIAFMGSLLPLGSDPLTPPQRTLFIVPNGGVPVRIAGPEYVNGYGKNIYLSSGTTSLNNAGEVVFGTYAFILVGSTNSVRTVFASGTFLPGRGIVIIPGSTGDLGSLPARLNNAGQVCFSYHQDAVYVHTPGTGIVGVALPGQAAPPGIGGTLVGMTANIVISAFNDAGTVAFTAPVAGSGVTTLGLFRFVPGTGIQTVAYANQAAPGAAPATFSNFAAISMNATGMMSFLGSMTGGTIPRSIYQQSSTNPPASLAFQNQASPLAGGTFNLFGTTTTRTLNSGSSYFFSDITGGAADYAEFLATSGSATVLMSNADTLPPGSRTSLRNLSVGEAGECLAFVAQQTGGRFSVMQRNLTSGVTTTVGTAGDVAPGTGGGVFRAANGSLFVNTSGTVVFNSQIIGGTQGNSNGIFLWTPTGGITKLVQTGDVDPNSGSPFINPALNFGPKPSPLNEPGQIVFQATVLGKTGLYVGTGGSPIQRVVQSGDVAPGGGTFTGFFPQAINQFGQVAFLATTTSGPGQNQGIFVGIPSGAVSKVALSGDPAPGGDSFVYFLPPSSFGFSWGFSFNDSGEVAFIASLGDGSTGGAFVGTGAGSLQALARDGSPSPAGGSYAFAGASADILINNQHDVAFRSALTGGGTDSAYFLRRGAAGSVQAVAVQGQSAPGTSGPFTTIQANVNNLLGEFFALGPTGELAFQTSFQTSAGPLYGMFRYRSDNLLEKIIARGDIVPGTGNGVLVTNSQGLGSGGPGRFAFWAAIAGGNVDDLIFATSSPSGFGISGQVKDGNGIGINGVNVILNGPVSGTTVTDNVGNYSFVNLAAGGSYTVAPAGNYSFNPANATFNSLNTNEVANFVATPAGVGPGISGQIKDVSGAAISGVTVALLNGTATVTTQTDGNGNYSFANLASGGNYTVTPLSNTLSFSPTSQTFNTLTVSLIANFVGTQKLISISGRITDASNNGVAFVTITLTASGMPTTTGSTDASGNYSFDNLVAGADYVVVPGGNFLPSSQAFNNLTASAPANFKSAPSIPPQCNTLSLGAATNFAVGTTPEALRVGDFNGDGKSDLVVVNSNSGNASVLLGSGTGSFSAATNFAVGSSPFSVAIGDFNGDGKLDLATANNASNNVSILLGSGTGNFSTATNFAVGAGPYSVAQADFNGDGQLDLAVANRNSNNVSILLGSGTGTFGAATNFAVGTNPQSVAVGDFNGDGKRDLVVANTGSLNVSILFGSGTGTFGAATNFAVGAPPYFVAAGDLNGDGNPDLVLANQTSNTVSILRGTGTGAFSAAANFAAGSQPAAVALGDFNGDGKIDLAVPNAASNNLLTFLGDGRGSLSTPTNFPVGQGRSVAVGDFNGDGKSDLALSNFQSNNILILLNNGTPCNTQSALTISGQIKSANNAPLADVTVTLSGPITRVTQTDANGNYSFPNLVPGGNYTVTLQSSYFVFAPSREDFFNLSSSQIANFIAAPLAVPSPTPTPNDDFGNTTRDASKWSVGAQTSATTAFDPQVTTTQTNGQLVVQPLTQATGLHYAGYVSANSFDLRNGSAKVEVAQAGTGGADTIFAVGTDADNFYRFMVHTPGPGTTLAMRARGRDGIERPLDTTTAQLVFQVNVNGQLTALSINYDPVQHRFMRFRHLPPQNSIVFETSPDNVDFTVQHTVVLQKSVSALTAELSAGTSNPANPGSTVFDNFGLVTSTFQFSAASYSIGEGDGSILVTVTRGSSLTDPATVDFATADGTARQKTKYTNSAGTLAFAAGVSSRTFRVLLVDNQLAEGDQSLNLLLSNPIGAGLNTPGRAVLNISDNDTTLATGNPMDDARYFTTQHYYDFLNRVPDQSGLDFWTGQITQCGTDVQCLRTQRITVSNAFFYEQEYQQTGSYVVRVYRAAFGNNQPISNNDNNPNFPNENKKLVNYSVFSTDRARVRGGPSLAQTQLDLANAFVLRSQFLARYPASLGGPAYVDALLAGINTDIGVDLSSQRQALIDLYNQPGQQGGRGAVLYRLADDNTQTNPINNRAFIDAEYNRSFVLTQYFGYLRRNPDIGGYIFWLGQVNSAPIRALEKQRAMVCSFITSTEYQQRFSPVATHNNTECQ